MNTSRIERCTKISMFGVYIINLLIFIIHYTLYIHYVLRFYIKKITMVQIVPKVHMLGVQVFWDSGFNWRHASASDRS